MDDKVHSSDEFLIYIYIYIINYSLHPSKKYYPLSVLYRLHLTWRYQISFFWYGKFLKGPRFQDLQRYILGTPALKKTNLYRVDKDEALDKRKSLELK